jgi:hypothetical protein
MTLNFQEIHSRIKEIGLGAPERQRRLDAQRARALDLLRSHAGDLELLRARVDDLVSGPDPNLRCARPAAERLDACFPLPEACAAAALLAVDGSQIAPDRHAALSYALVNVGAVVLRPDSGQAPETFTRTELLYEDDLRDRRGVRLDESGLALRRDAAERRLLLELARDLPAPRLALTDGPLELWGAKDPGAAGGYRRHLERYLADLEEMAGLGVVLGGYVDKPAADLLVRLLEIAAAGPDDLKKVGEFHPLAGVTDRWLFAGLLDPGERSAVFALQSGSRREYTGRREIHFFYLNAGSPGHPALARVELPAWVAGDSEKLNLLHAALAGQCALLGARPYPYVLHRAHETARVSRDEQAQVEMMLAVELRQRGAELEEASGKQTAKDHGEKKTRYRR